MAGRFIGGDATSGRLSGSARSSSCNFLLCNTRRRADTQACGSCACVSLIAGVALVAIALAGVIARRTQLGDDRDRRLEATAELVAARLDETIARVVAALTVASATSTSIVIADALAIPCAA